MDILIAFLLKALLCMVLTAGVIMAAYVLFLIVALAVISFMEIFG